MSKSILFIAPSAYPLGGVQTWLDYILPGIRGHGFTSTLAIPTGKFHDAQAYLLAHPFDSVELINNPTGSIEGRNEAIKELILKVCPDIILVVNIVDVYRAVNELRAHLKTHAKVVTTLHGVHPGLINDINQFSSVIDGVISTNRLTQKLVNIKTDIHQSRSYYAPYGVSDKLVPRKPQKKFTVAYVGRFEESQKRINDLVEIIHKLNKENPSINFLLAGDGPDLRVFNRWHAEQNFPQNIKYLGLLTPKELDQQVYAVADVLLLTSSWETGPIVAWEAIRQGVTLVSSRYIGYLEEGSLKHRVNCLMFGVGDVEDAVKQVLKAKSIELRTELNRNALTLVENQYSIESSLNSWASCLKAITSLKPKGYNKEVIIRRDKGRISNFLFKALGNTGLTLAERIRRALKISFEHTEAGSEWPHCGRSLRSDRDARELNRYID